MRRFLLPVLLLGVSLAAPWAQAATPPQQPEQGPGGRDYKSTEVVKRAIGTASTGTFVFHGADTPTKPRPASMAAGSIISPARAISCSFPVSRT